ncbi:adenosylcobinamide-GDP ribazoletransferase [Sinisalibacter lacisalsi]|uniref:Adenosylcobinamide-GDP ribazoletransferase n=1 Tax=Sinisalibacter lacisalsi TaxID=1526570 RepID=A0ABQ1QQA5_9RHOB|nr:adenosylcobinamide-GDP ribazoletransferase [Sinisalibacter lacisalsi]GGD40529.1 adenosylcobinamide-GDP ribazoletransferase [Sinisalibacter lacisalsi]
MSTESVPLARPGDIAEALALLTRLPMPAQTEHRGAQAAWAWPLAGVAVALLAGLAGWGALTLGLPVALAAGLILATQVAATGALHEDGLADSADGLWGGQTRARRLEIMKDSRIGSYGVLALILSIGLRWSALAAILDAGALFAPLIAVAVLSRAPMAVLMAALPNARGDGLAQSVGRPAQDSATLGVLVALALAFAILGWGTLAPILWAAFAVIALAAIARAKIGGQTGDILGATQQVAEIAALAALAATL